MSRTAVAMASERVLIPPIGLEGDLARPKDMSGVVIFAHGSGSSRLSPRNTYVARALNQARIGTLLFDLLKPSEASDRRNVFDIELLATRLGFATEWLVERSGSDASPVGYFGASTGAAAALLAAGWGKLPIAAVVSRGGRPDLAERALPSVRSPTLLIVGADDFDVLALNRAALAKLRCEKSLVTVPGATHLFAEPGALDAVIDLSLRWFADHFGKPAKS